MLFVSSKEPPVVKKMCQGNFDEIEEDQWPEEYGFDFAWVTPFGVAGVQRKKFPSDFLASCSDERLYKEILQMGDTFFKMIILEGEPNWGSNGSLQGQYAGGISINHLNAMIFSITFFHRIHFVWTKSLSETIGMVARFYKWSTKEYHTRFGEGIEYPKKRDENGNRIKVDWREWILQHFHDINQVRARAILKYEPEPLRWWNDGKNLTDVPGIGPKIAKKLIDALKPDQGGK